jgi:hypothetical protein
MPDPKTLIPKSPKGTMRNFVDASLTPLSSYNLEGDTLKAAEDKLSKNYMMDDVINNIPDELSLHTLLTGDDIGTTPEDRTHITVDTKGMAAEIEQDIHYSYDDRKKYLRTLQIIDGMQKSNLTITRAPSGRYWLESNEDGKRVYAKNSILEVAELLEKYKTDGAKVNYGDTEKVNKTETEEDDSPIDNEEIENTLKKVAERDADLEWRAGVVKDVAPEFKLEGYEQMQLGSLGVDLGSTIGAMVMKASVIGAPFAPIVSLGGGAIAAGMEAYGDYKDPNVTIGQLWTNLGIRAAAEGLEAFTVIPASLPAGLRKAIPAARRYMRWGLKAGMLEGVLSTEWNETLNKEIKDWGVDDYRKMSTIVYIMLSGAGATMAGKRRAKGEMAKSNKPAARSIGEIKKTPVIGEPSKTVQRDAIRSAAVAPEKNAIKNAKKKLISDTEVASKAKVKTIDDQIKADNIKLKKEFGTRSKLEIEAKAVVIPKKKALIPRPAIKKGDSPAVKREGRRLRAHNDAIIAENKANKNLAAKQKQDAIDIKKKNDVTLKKEQAAVENAGKKIKEGVASSTDARIKSISKEAETSRKALVAKKMVDTHAKAVKGDAQKKATTVEKEVERVFGSPSNKWRNKAQDDAFGKKTAQGKRDAAKADRAAKVEAETKVSKARKKAQKMESEIASNKDKKGFDVDAKKRDLEVQKGKVEDLEKRAKKWYTRPSREIKKLQARRAEAKLDGTSLTSKRKSISNYTIGTGDSYMGIGNKALVNAVRGSDAGRAIIGDKDYEYTPVEARRRLKDNFGYSDADLDTYTYNQLRELVKREEGRALGKDGDREPARVKANPFRNFRNTSKNIKKKHNGGKLIARPGTVRKAEGGIKTDDPLELKNYQANYEFNNWYMKNKDIASEEEVRAKQAELRAKYNLNQSSTSAVKSPIQTATGLLKYIQPSDFGKRSRTNINTYALRDFQAPVTYSAPVTNMPGFPAVINDLNTPLRVDSADSFQTMSIKNKHFNARLKDKLKVIVKNAEHVLMGQGAQLAARNQTEASYVQAYNQNMAARNAADASFTQQENKADSIAETENIARNNRLFNGINKGVDSFYKGRHRDSLTSEFNRIAGLKNKYISEYAPRIEQALSGPDPSINVNKIKLEFSKNSGGYNPDFLEQDLLNLKSQFDSYS